VAEPARKARRWKRRVGSRKFIFITLHDTKMKDGRER
jgi:hypothetical protein